jgi:MFS family permease
MHSRDTAILGVYGAAYGLGMGGQNVILPLLVGQCFGALDFSRIIGIMMGGFAIGILVGIPGAGWIYDSYRSYEPAFLACIALFLISTGLALLIRPDRDRRRFVER